MASASSKEFLDIQATVECGFTLKLVRDMIKTYKQLVVLSATSGGISDFFYKCYWNPCRSNKCKPYFSAFFNYSDNEETIKGNKKNIIKNIIKLLCLLRVY